MWIIVGVALVVAYLAIKKPLPIMHPTVMPPGVKLNREVGSPLDQLSALPDPSSVPLGTRIGFYVVRQSRQVGAAPYWAYESGGVL